MSEAWSPLLGYVLEFYVVAGGLLAFFFKNGEDAGWIQEGKWIWGNALFFLKSWVPEVRPSKGEGKAPLVAAGAVECKETYLGLSEIQLVSSFVWMREAVKLLWRQWLESAWRFI